MTLTYFITALVWLAIIYWPLCAAFYFAGHIVFAGFTWLIFALHFLYVLSKAKEPK